MKRSRPLRRGKRLRRKTPLKASKPWYSSGTLKRKQRIRRVSKKRRRELRRWAETKRIVADRSGGRCEGPATIHVPKGRTGHIWDQAWASGRCSEPADDPHHVLPRGRGGEDTPENALGLCRYHHDWAHEHPVAAKLIGLLR